MKTMTYAVIGLFLLATTAAMSGCDSHASSAGLGALGGAAAGVGGYEYNVHKEKKRLEDDYRSGRISQKEYEIRRDQLERTSIFR